MPKKLDETHNDMLAGLKLGSTIAARQLKYSMLLALGLGLIIVVLRGYHDYQWLAEIYHQSNQRVTSSNVPVAVQSLLRRDRELADVMARGMMNQRSIQRVTLLNAEHGIFFDRERPAGEIPTSLWGDRMYGGIQTVIVPVRDPEQRPAATVGEMVVVYNPQVFTSAFMSRLSWSFLTTMVLAVVMAFMFAALSYYILSRPLVQLANYLVRSDPSDDTRPLEMPPYHRYDDEIQLLGSVTVGLFGVIRRQIGQLRKARDELMDANVNLEARVAERTDELKEAMQKLEVQASTDSLTSLPNRRSYLARFEEAVSTWRRRDTPVSIILLDIDRFKSINDTYGHQTGDAVLVELSRIMRATVREIDLPARMGGEEFAVLLPGEEIAGALKLAERLRVAFENASVSFGGNVVSFTASFGVAGLPSTQSLKLFDADIRGYIQSLKDWENSDISSVMYSLADRALYEAKENGRNRCKQCDFRQIPDYSEA
ncbi:GGDEF domain-containing protein [Thalassospira sp. SM2505]|uniref:GGDEF domain-containing protein n=1 Tax=Thalassospira profundimaris TaxID=502049 RepID=UPI000DEDBF35|nr:GGDEF domain-containing protein [Thalassospira profundimaris]